MFDPERQTLGGLRRRARTHNAIQRAPDRHTEHRSLSALFCGRRSCGCLQTVPCDRCVLAVVLEAH
eukprot:scaffold24009_cov68-Phaeocystis_antarctica.AAC.5